MSRDDYSIRNRDKSIAPTHKLSRPVDSADDSNDNPSPETLGKPGSWLPSVPNLRLDAACREKDPMHLPPGEMYGEFFVRSELGRGTFGVVYLAEQLPLNRKVALKVTDATREDGCSLEGMTMAQLEHPSIVRIYSQFHDEVNQRRLLCMQYVSGMDLRELMVRLKELHGDNWRGIQLLDILDEDAERESAVVVVRTSSLADRRSLELADKLTAVCWIGAQSAFALDHAHQAGYIHRDIKPANTIVNRFGRPMLVDFNLAVDSRAAGDDVIVGGTLPYMPPESLLTMASVRSLSGQAKSTSIESTNSGSKPSDETLVQSSQKLKNDLQIKRSSGVDIYALGVTLWEMACGERPFVSVSLAWLSDPERLEEALETRARPPRGADKIVPVLRSALLRAIDANPDRRYSSAGEFAETLQGAARQSRVLKGRARRSRLGRFVLQRPVVSLFIAAILPHVVASGLQIAYNQAEIVSLLGPSARELFNTLLFTINPIAYGICAVFVAMYVFSIAAPWLRQRRGETQDPGALELSRGEFLKIPRRLVVIGTLGWLGGAIAFPGTIYFAAEHFQFDVWIHFICSFAFSCLIGVTFSYALSLAVVIYGFYPTCFSTPYRFAELAKQQLGPFRSRWGTLSIIAGVIPLSAAVLLVVNFSPGEIDAESAGQQWFAFKGLVIGLILSSAFGFGFVRYVGQAMTRLIDRCIGDTSAPDSGSS